MSATAENPGEEPHEFIPCTRCGVPCRLCAVCASTHDEAHIPGFTVRPGNWMAQWLEAYLEANADNIAEQDAIVLDQIREHLTGEHDAARLRDYLARKDTP